MATSLEKLREQVYGSANPTEEQVQTVRRRASTLSPDAPAWARPDRQTENSPALPTVSSQGVKTGRKKAGKAAEETTKHKPESGTKQGRSGTPGTASRGGWSKEVEEARDYSLRMSLLSAAARGVGQIAQFGGDTLALAEDAVLAPFELFSGQNLGDLSDDAPFNTWARGIRKEGQAVEEAYRTNRERGGKGAALLEDLGAATVAAVPQAVVAMLTGGGSVAAQGAAGLSRTAAQAVSPTVANTVREAVSGMARNPNYWTSFAQVVGGSYESALEDMRNQEAETAFRAMVAGEPYQPPENENAMRAKAALYAIGNGLLNAAVEIGGGIQTLPQELRRGENAWKTWVDTMVDEGKEEAVQGVIERALQNPIYGADNPLFSATDERAIVNPWTAAQEFTGGAIVGGILGGGQIGVARGIDAAARRAAEAEVRRRAAGQQSAPTAQMAPTGAENAAPGVGTAVNENGLSAYTERERENLASGKKNRIVSTFQEAVDFVRNALENRQSTDRAYLGKVPEETARRVLDDTGVDITGYNAVIPSDAIRHMFKTHGNAATENARGQIAISPEAAARIPEVLADPDRIMLSPQTDGRGLPTLLFEKDLGDYYVTAQAVADGSHSIQTDTLYIRKKKNSQSTVIDAGQQTSPEDNVQNVPPQSSSGLNIPQAGMGVNSTLRQSGLAAGAAEADIRAAEEISRATGREIRFYDGNTRQDPSGRANGYFDGETIYVNSRSANPKAQIIAHEMTHSVELADAYQELSSLVFDRIQRTGGDLEQLRAEKRDLYTRMGRALQTQEQIDQEIVAEYVEHNLLTNEQEILDLTQENPGLGRRIMNWIDRVLARLGSGAAQERAFLTRARNTYARALEQTGAPQQPADLRTAGANQQTVPQPAEPTQASPAAGPNPQRSREDIRQEVRALREDYAAGRISDEEFDQALDAIMEEEGLEDVSMLNRYSFGGERAQQADLEALDRAQEMERRGVAMETIFRDTGWYTGADGKWRFEIDDSGMVYSRRGDLGFRERNPDYARYRDLLDRAERSMLGLSDEALTAAEEAELAELRQTYGTAFRQEGRVSDEALPSTRLADYVRHDELYQNYPQLRDATLQFEDLSDGIQGTYNKETNAVTLDNSLRSSPEDTLVHEFQHAIQTEEGFARGSSPEYWSTPREAAIRPEYQGRIREARQRLREVENRFRQEWPNDTINLENARAYYAWDDLYWKEQSQEGQQRYLERMQAIEEAASEGGWEDLLNEYYAARAERDAAVSAGLDARRTPQDAYRNTAGEIEARDAARRRRMTPEQRRKTLPDTGGEDTVFAEGADRFSDSEPDLDLQREADGLFLQGVDPDTIRELTGLERTEDGNWRFALDSAPAAGYDGGRTTDRQGGLDDGPEIERNDGDPLLAQVRGPEAVDAGVRGEGIQENGGIQEESGQRAGVPRWARGRLIDRPSAAAGIAAENAGRYGAGTFVVEDTAIKERNPGAWALTSGGRIYISDSIPAELADVVGYHEAVHAAKQNENESYLELLNRTDDEVSFGSQKAQDVINLLAGRRFNGADFLSLDDSQVKTVLDELNALVWGFHKADPENARAQFAEMFQNYDAYIADLDAAMESAAEPEISDNPLPTLGEGSDIQYSLDEQAAEDNPLQELVQERAEEPTAYDTLPSKARSYLDRVENQLLYKLGNSLNVPRAARRDYLKGITREVSEEYLRDGRVSQETLDRLFDEAYEQGVVADRDFYNEYGDLRRFLHDTRLEVAQEDANDIPDFNDFRRSNFGRLNISTRSGRTNVDQVFQELSARWPEFFNEERVSAPSDQLQRIAEVAESFRIAERTLDEYYGDRAAEFRKYAKNDFENAVTDMLGELRNVRRYAEGRAAETDTQAPATLEEVNELWARLKDARRVYERAAARNLLTDQDEMQVGRLLRGEMELRHLNPETDNVRGVTEVYQAKQEYERISRRLKQWNRSRKAALRQQAEQLLETANSWKDKKSGYLYARETMERNIRDIVPDEQLADQIIDTYFTPVHRAAADANRLKNQYRDRVRKLNLSRKVAEGNLVSEAHAVQLLGEAEDNIRMLQQSRRRKQVRDGKTLEEWQAVVRDLWAENPNLDQDKIRGAVQEFRTIYDQLFQQMNDARVRNGYEPVNYRNGYFPHFQPGDGDGILATFGRALGIGTEVTALPTTINGMTHAFRPGIRWFGNAQERLGFNTAYDAVEGFDRYIEGVADVIYQTDNIQRLRALASEIRYRTGDEGIRKQIDRVREDTSKSDEEQRKAIEEITEDGRFALSNFVVDLDEYTNLLANKKSLEDRKWERKLNRRRYNFFRALESRVAANMVAINPASWLTNFIPLTQGSALLDRGMILRGMWETLQSYKESDGIVERSTFLTNRRGSDPLVQIYEQGAVPDSRARRAVRSAGIAAGRAGDFLSRPMEWIDNFTADSLVRARFRQNLRRGLSENAAMADADAFAASVMADRSKGATPTMFSRTNPISKLFTQFQLEVNNQLSYVFKDLPREKKNLGVRALAAALLKFALGAWLYDEAYEYLIGRRPALDPIGILNDTVGDLTGWEVPNLVELGVGAVTGDMPSFQTEQPGLYEATGNLGTALAEELPFIGGILGGGRLPIESAVPDFGIIRRAAMDESWAPEKRFDEAMDELQKPLTYLVTPYGGGQLKRVLQALRAVKEGGVYSLDAEGKEQLQYPVYNDTWEQAVANALMGSVFGTTTLPTGREWIESGFDTMNARQTAAYQGMVDVGVPGEDAYELLRRIESAKKTEEEGEAEQKRRLLREADISGEGKSVVYYGLLANDAEMETMDALADLDADMGEVTRVLMEIKDEGQKEEDKRSVVDILSDSSLTDNQKAEIFRSTASESKEAKLDLAEEYGVSGGEWIAAEEAFSQELEDRGADSMSQAIAAAAIRTMDGLDRQERATLWQLQNKGWSWKNNPFDKRTGREIYERLHAEE